MHVADYRNFVFLVKFLYCSRRGMSRAVVPVASASSQSNDTEESDERSEGRTSTCRDLSLLCVTRRGDDDDDAVHGILLRGSYTDGNVRAISGSARSLDQIQRILSQPRRGGQRSSTRTSVLERHHPRRKIGKAEQSRAVAGSNNGCCAIYKIDGPTTDASARKFRSPEKRTFHAFDVARFGRRLRCQLRASPPLRDLLDGAFRRSLPRVETIRFVGDDRARSDVLVPRTSSADQDARRIGVSGEVAWDVATLFERLDLGRRENRLGAPAVLDDEDEEKRTTTTTRIVADWPRLESSESTSRLDKIADDDDQSRDYPSRMDFSCGDESRTIEEIVPVDPDVAESKTRSVQWNDEVDVIYYAGDADGGKVVRREREPLQEETEQHARNRFIQLVLNKSLISSMSGY